MSARILWLCRDPEGAFETDWIHELAGGDPLKPAAPVPADHAQLYPNACFVFNHTVDYEAYFLLYEAAGMEFVCIHLSDETLADSSDYLNLRACRRVFRNYYHPIHSHHPKVTTFGLGYKAGFQRAVPALPDTHRQWYHWCFAGAVHHEHRAAALRAFEDVRPFLCAPTDAQFHSPQGLDTASYRALFAYSKFALCPVGQGNLDTFRFYEALEAGCVPVVVESSEAQPYDYWERMFPHEQDPLPIVKAATWGACAEQVRELLRSPNDYVALRTRAIAFWHRWKKEWGRQLQEASNFLSSITQLDCS
jgi:hypothetical protein